MGFCGCAPMGFCCYEIEFVGWWGDGVVVCGGRRPLWIRGGATVLWGDGVVDSWWGNGVVVCGGVTAVVISWL